MRVQSYSIIDVLLQFLRRSSALITVGMLLLLGISQLWQHAVWASKGMEIPGDAIRIRILANSDSTFDQQVKADVQGQVSQLVQSWGEMPETHDEAYTLISSKLPAIEKRVNDVLVREKTGYRGKIELGNAVFPDKIFHGDAYEAGEYETLLITLGDGNGGNWWCVLFPPLCLTAAVALDDADAAGTSASASVSGASNTSDVSGEVEKPKAKFLIWTLIEKLFAWLASLFG